MRIVAMIACAAMTAACQPERETGGASNDAAPEAPAAPAGPAAPVAPAAPPAPAAQAAHPCSVQDGKPVAARLKALGTEPFWAAEVDGRCVTYKTPEDQAGTRIWAKFSGTAESGQWSGFLGGQRFLLVTRIEANCSDGMSDRRYPLAATVTIGSEERRGCAEVRR